MAREIGVLIHPWRWICNRFGVFAIVGLLAGCAPQLSVPGAFHTPDAGDAAQVAATGWSSAASAELGITVNPLLHSVGYYQQVYPSALRDIEILAVSCGFQLGPQMAGPIQSAAEGAAEYGLGGMGTGAAAQAAFRGPIGWTYAIYGGVADAASGAVNGVISEAYARRAELGECVQKDWDEVQDEHTSLKGIDVFIDYGGKPLGDSGPPDLLSPGKIYPGPMPELAIPPGDQPDS